MTFLPKASPKRPSNVHIATSLDQKQIKSTLNCYTMQQITQVTSEAHRSGCQKDGMIHARDSRRSDTNRKITPFRKACKNILFAATVIGMLQSSPTANSRAFCSAPSCPTEKIMPHTPLQTCRQTHEMQARPIRATRQPKLELNHVISQKKNPASRATTCSRTSGVKTRGRVRPP